jgi:protein-tyrosine phosphatase
MFREVNLKKIGCRYNGRLLLHSMPGRYEDLQIFFNESKRLDMTIFCLVGLNEIIRHSPLYADEIIAQNIPKFHMFPIPDFGIPSVDEEEKFLSLSRLAASFIQQGRSVLTHCGQGIGRSLLLSAAICFFLSEGKIFFDDIMAVLLQAGSYAETVRQREYLLKMAEIIKKIRQEDYTQ